MGVVSVVVVLSGDVDKRLKAGRLRESKEEAPRDIGRPNPIEPFSVVEAKRESNELQPNETDVGLGDSISRTPSMT